MFGQDDELRVWLRPQRQGDFARQPEARAAVRDPDQVIAEAPEKQKQATNKLEVAIKAFTDTRPKLGQVNRGIRYERNGTLGGGVVMGAGSRLWVPTAARLGRAPWRF